MNKLFSSIGEIALSEEEFEKHQENIRLRDEVIERNKKKKKGAADEPVPFVLDVKQSEEGRFYVKNMSVKLINLAKNGIGDTSAAHIKKFTENQGKHVQLFLQGNKITKKSKETLKLFENILL